jgi:hypothetical protein
VRQGLLSGLVVVALGGCGADVGGSDRLPGQYVVTDTPGCNNIAVGSTFEIWPHANGTLSLQGYDVSLTYEGSAYAGASGRCVPANPPYLQYQGIRLTRSDATVHVEVATAAMTVTTQDCNQAAALALAPQATSCAFDGRLTQAAPTIATLSPAVISRSDCTQQLVLEGTDFTPDVQVGYEMNGIAAYPATENCPSSWLDTDYMTVCNLVVERRASDRIVAHLDDNSWAPYACFPAGTLQLVIENPRLDGTAGAMATSALEAYVTLELTD